jgi:RNA:NAD 2'-phosphotransferase (TPT1/KptA family)
VSSRRGRCERKRRVILIRNRRRRPDFEAGATFTDENGSWRITKPNPRGRYYVVTPSRVRSRYGHRHECGGARSRTVRA